MIWRPLLALSLAFTCGFSHAADSAKASGNNSIAVGTARDVTQNNDNGIRNANNNTQNVKVFNMANVSKLNALQRHQDALLLAENPTKVRVTNSQFLQWSADSELFLTVTLRNVSKLPAYKVEYGIPDQARFGPSKTVRFMVVAPSASIPKNVRLEYGIEPDEEFVTPLIGISELRQFMKLREGYCIVTARVIENSQKFPELPFKQGQWGTAMDYALPFAFTYRSIFEQNYIRNSALSVIVAKRDSLVPPGPQDGSSYLKCLD